MIAHFSDYFWLAAHPSPDQTTAAACPPQLLQGYEHEHLQAPHLFPYHQTSQSSGDQMSIDLGNPGDIFHFDKSFADSNHSQAAAAEMESSASQQGSEKILE